MNLWLKKVKPDGNCLFRAISDQLYGKEFSHVRLRGEVVDYLRGNNRKHIFFNKKKRLSKEEYIYMMS